MSRWTRPVRGDALRASPELRLRLEGEEDGSLHATDEGAGTGFDNLDPSAVAQRIWRAGADPQATLARYRDALLDLGWRVAYAHSADWLELQRDDDETLHLQVLPSYGADPAPRLRLVLRVQGTWPPGREPSA